MKVLLALIPIIIATAGILKTKNTFSSMLTGSLLGTVLYVFQKGFSESTVINVIEVYKGTFLDNSTVLLSVYLLRILVYLIKNSTIINAVNSTTQKYMNSPARFLGFLLLFATLFSLDDYLACLALGAIMSDAALKNGYTLEKTAYMINISAVCCCCLSPFSSWAPVIRSALATTGHESIYYIILPYNISAITGFMLVIALCLFNRWTLVTEYRMKKTAKADKKSSSTREMLAFSAVFTMIIIFMIYLNFVRHTSNALIKSTIPAVLMSLMVFFKIKAIDLKGIKKAFCEASYTSFSLSTLLLSIWLLTNVCNKLLLLGSSISAWVLTVNLPYFLLPAGVFVITGCFAFATGSAYGAFGLFIPLATQLSSNCSSDITQILCTAAAVSGSLLASGSFSSDTLKLSADSTGCDLMKLQYDQLPLTGFLFISGALGFLIAGLSSVSGSLLAAVLPYATVLLVLVYYTALKKLIATFTNSASGYYFQRIRPGFNLVRKKVYIRTENSYKMNRYYTRITIKTKLKQCRLTTLKLQNTFIYRTVPRKVAFI